mmetsp:Transcript_22708/g.74246  ORF Transcript_22708/g.74246 Transcript_22708/m.74246 type:complete len:205 (+) Transcript_22708:665-1279(+)
MRPRDRLIRAVGRESLRPIRAIGRESLRTGRAVLEPTAVLCLVAITGKALLDRLGPLQPSILRHWSLFEDSWPRAELYLQRHSPLVLPRRWCEVVLVFVLPLIRFHLSQEELSYLVPIVSEEGEESVQSLVTDVREDLLQLRERLWLAAVRHLFELQDDLLVVVEAVDNSADCLGVQHVEHRDIILDWTFLRTTCAVHDCNSRT